MSKTRMGKRVASLLLSLVMMLSLLPTTVYATEDTGGGTGATYDAVQQTESGDNTENTGKLESTGEGEDDSEAGNEGETSVTYVAQVGDVQYKTLEEAIGVAADGATVSLLDNVTLNTTLTVAKSITIDVGGFTLTVATDGDGIVVNNATLTLTGTGKYVFNCTASGSDGIFVNNTVEGGTSELNLNGNVDINVSGNVSSAIHAYASAGKAVVNINAGTITARGSKQFPGVVVDQNATLNMTGGTFDLSMDFDAYSDGNDVVGVLIWGGSSHKQENCAVNISGGTFKVGGKNAFAQAVQVGMSNGYSENCTVNISGGNVVLNPTEGGKGYVYTAYKASYATAAITGGTVSGKVTAIANTYIRDLENDGLTISGGTFSGITVDEKYLAEGKTLNESGNVVDKAPEVKRVTVNGVGYDTLAAAIAAAQDGDTVTLLADVDENVEIAAGKNLTLDLNGCTLNGCTGTNKAALTNYGTITITDSSEDKTGTIKRDDIGTVGETSYYVILNQGTMTIESGTVINNSGYKKANSTGSMVGSSLICNGDCNGGSTLTINGGTFTQYNFIAIKNGALGVLYVTGGTITSNHSAIQNWFEADITGGEINGQLWTDAYTAGVSDGKTKIGGNATFTGEIVMDIYGNSVAPTLEITSGKLDVTNWKITDAAANVGAKPAISGGTFKAAVPAKYCAEGFIPTANADGTFSVKAGAYVAEVNGTGYETLAAAIKAANAGDTITLLADVNLDSAQTINKKLTIDLNGKTIDSTKYRTIQLNAGADLTVKDSASGGKITNTYTGSAYPATIYLNAAGTKFTLESGTIESDPNETSLQSVAINSEKNKDCEVNIKGGSVTVPEAATEGRAIVASTNSMTLNISGGTITGGLHGVDAYSGSTVNITGGTITARYMDTGVIKEAYGMRLIGTANVTVAGGTITGVKMDDNGYKLDVPKVTLESGTINGSFYSVTKGTITFTVAENATIVLANDSAAKFLPDTVKLVQNADGTYGIKAGTYVAQVGSTKYETLQEAINATVTGDTVTLLADVDLGSSVSFYNKKDTSVCNLTFDLNGHTITSAIGDNGTVLAAREGLVIKNGAIVNTSESTNKKTSAICVTSKGTTTIENVTVTSKVSGVYICQLTSTGAEVVNVESGTFISGEYGVYIANPKGSTTKSPVETLNINGGTINGTHTGVYAKGAESGSRNAVVNVNITAGTVSSVGVYGAKEEQPVNLTVSGGTISDKLHIDNLGGKALVTGGAVKGAVTNNGTLTISGGTFNGDLTNKTNGSITITGGTFATKPNETYLADGYVFATNGDGTYGVTAGTVYVAAIGENKYTSLQAAIEAATRNATVKLLADTRENVTISTPHLTLDLNGFTLNGSTGERKPALTVTARVTVKDSSENQTGTIMREDTAENSGVSSHYVIDVQGDGWLTFESGNVKNNSGIVGVTGASLVRVGDDSVAQYPGLNIKGGTFTQDNFIVIKVDRGELFLNGGTLNSAHSYAIEDWHRATIKGGTVNGTVAAWTYSGGLNSDLTISGGAINGNVTSVNYGNAENRTAKVSITGGTVNGELDTRSYDPATNELTSIDDAAKATIKVTGGTFDKDPTKYVVEDSAVNQNADGTFGVAKAYLAKVGKTSYYTMDEARKAQSTSGEDIVLLRDYTTGSPFRSGISARVVDLNGYTWTCTGKDANSAAFEISNHDAMLTVKNGKVVSSQLVGLIPSAMDGTITYDNSSLVFDGVEMSTTAHSGIETNGNNTNDTVTLKNSTLNVPNGFGIYFPSSGTLTIDKSTINAKTMGVQVCAGSLNINAGSGITVTGDAVPKTGNDGAIEDGAAISIVNRTGYKGLGKIEVTGGTFTAKAGNDAIKAYDWADKTEKPFTAKDNVAVSGGTFSSAVPEGLCAAGYIPTKNADDTYGVKAGTYVAEVGSTKYESLAEAINAAANGATVTLLADCESDRINLEDKSITVDLNGKTLTSTAAYGVMFCAKNGNTITVNGTTEGSRLVGTLMVTAETDGHIVINGGIYESAKYCPIYINGAVSSDSSTLTVKDATITALSGDSNQDNGVAVYLAGYSTSTFTNTTITAPVTGLEIRAGKLTLTDCTVTGGSGEVVTNANGNGTTVTNAAVAISQHTTKKNIDVTINGGTYTATAAVYQTDVQDTGSENVKTNIKAGTFNGTVYAATNNTVAVSGGRFSSAVPENYCADGYIPTANGDGTFGVKAGKYVAINAKTQIKYESLQAAIDAARSNQSVWLLEDITLTERVVVDDPARSITLNLRGHSITARGNALLNNGKLTIMSTGDDSKAGKIESETGYAVGVGSGSTLTISSGTLEGREGAVITGTSTGATIDIRKNATLIATDNAVIAGNGSKRDGNPNTILVKGGTFIGGIESDGYIACGIYAPWKDNVTVSGGTFNITNGAGIVARAGTVKVTGGTFNCTGNGTGWVGDNKNQIPCAALVFDKAANYPALTDASKILVSGGSFSTDPAANGATLAAGYVATQTDGVYKVAKADPVAAIGDVKYDTLSQAIAALEGTGGTIKLLQDINAPSMNYKITENITIDLNGHDITGSGAEGVFYVYTSGHLTITGDGVITAVENNKAAIAVQVFSEKAKVTLEGGTYKQQITNKDDPHFDLIYVYYGTAEIKGGTYEGATPDWTLNCIDDSYKAGTAHITVTGGTFVGFDPANNTAEGEGTNFVPEGYVPKANGDGSYTVVKGTYVAEYNDTKYTSLQEAIDAASQKNGGQAVVTLLGNLTITETVNFAKQYGGSVLLNLGGYTLTGENCRALQINKGNLYLENGTVTSTGIADSKSVIRIGSDDTTYSGSNPMLYMRNGAKVLAPVSYGVTIFGSATVSETLTVAGNASIEATGPSPAISGQGGQAYHVDGKGTKVIITGNAVVSATNNYAIYHPDNGTLDIQGGTITGKGGIQMCSGTLNISGSPKIEALGKANHETGASGPIYDIAAISVVNRGYPGGAPVVTITGTPTVTAVDGEVIHAYTWSSNAESEWADAGKNINVSGGTYSKTFNAAYLAADCTLVANNDTTYTVKQKPVAEYNGTQYTSLPQAILDANNSEAGGTVKLLDNVTLTRDLGIGGSAPVTLDLDKKTLTLNGAQIYTQGSATVTINNGTIKRTDEPTSGSANNFAIQVMSGSSLVLGTTSADTVTIESTYGVYNAGGTLTVSHAVITTDGWSIAVNDSASKTGVVTIGEGAVITSRTGNCISTRVNSKPNVTITGGQLTSNGTNWDAGVIYWASEGTLTITGGTFTASSAESSEAAAVYQKNGTVKISGNTAKLLGNNALVVQAGDGSTGTMVTELSGGTYSTKPEETWVVNGCRAIDNTDGTYTVKEANITIQVTSRIQDDGDTTVSTTTGGGMYCEGEKVTVTTSNVIGFEFLGWYEKVNGKYGEELSADLSYTFEAEKSCTLVALYSPVENATLTVKVTASAFRITGSKWEQNNGGMYKLPVGSSVTVTYTDDTYAFLYWVNGSDKIVSTNSEYTFTLGSNTELRACTSPRNTEPTNAMVVFKTAYDQVLTAQRYDVAEEIVFPMGPSKTGYKFIGWSMTQAEIRAAMAANDCIVVTPKYETLGTKYTVTVRYAGIDKAEDKHTINVGDSTLLTAAERVGEKTFSYWMIDDQIVSYLTTLTVFESKDVTVTAVYGVEANAKAKIRISDVSATQDGLYYLVTFTQAFALPEDATLVLTGFIRADDEESAANMNINRYSKIYKSSLTTNDGTYYQTIASKNADKTYYMMAFVQYKDAKGDLQTVYSECVQASYASLKGGN